MLFSCWKWAVLVEGFWPRKWTVIVEPWYVHIMWWRSEPPQPSVKGDLRDIYIGW